MSDAVERGAPTDEAVSKSRGLLSQLKVTLQRDATQDRIRFIVLVYITVATAASVQYAGLLLIVNSQLPAGGAAILTQYVLLPVFASGILAVGLGLHVGKRSEDEMGAVAASGIGTYLGYIGFVLATVVATRVVGSDFISSALGLTTEGLLSELVFVGLGVGFVGAGTGYLGFRSKRATDRPDADGETDARAVAGPDEPTADVATDGGEADTGSRLFGGLFGALAGPSPARTTWMTVYAFALVGVGYGISTVAVSVGSTGFVPILISLSASYAIVFSAPLLAAYFGSQVGRSTSTPRAVSIGFVGGGLGFVALVLAMVVIGSFGPDAGLLNNLSSSVELLQGNVGAASSVFAQGIETVFGAVPRGYEISRILLLGGVGSALAGAVAAFAAQDDRGWV